MKIDARLASKLQKLGATRLNRCYNCGTCTAICPLSKEDAEFPRTLIRYALLGAEQKLLSSPALWLCYYCGECSDSCPRDADPGSFIMAARRYATRQYSWGKVASVFYDSPLSSLAGLVMVTVLAVFGFLMMKGNGTFSSPNLQTLFSFQALHDIGLILGAFIGLSVLANVVTMSRSVRVTHDRISRTAGLRIWITSLLSSVMRFSMAQMDYLKCTNRNRYIAHMALFWGFIGLAVATSVDFIIGLGKIPLYPVPLQRIVGILSGVAFTAGAGYYLYKRIKKDERHVMASHFTDWAFVIIMFLAGVTGLLLTLSLYLGAGVAAYSLYGVHLVTVFDLLVLAPFTKFAHAVYRPVAIWMNQAGRNFSGLRATEGA